jgi:hypothetical protein
MLEKEQRPIVLYAGNAALRSQIAKLLGDITRVVIVDNVHPSAGTEHLGPAQNALEQFYNEARLRVAPGVESLSAWSRLPFVPVANAFSRVVDFLWHREGNADRGVLGVDVGAATTTMAANFGGRSYVNVYNHGTASGISDWVRDHDLDDLMRWIPDDLETDALLAMLYNTELQPTAVPQTPVEQEVALAVVREMIRSTLSVAQPTWDTTGARFGEREVMPRIDPIVISGGGIVHVPRPGLALLAMLDGLQPVGISTLLLDVNHAAPAIGAVAGIRPLIAASALEAGALVSLGTVISPVGQARPGDTVLKLRIGYDGGSTLDVEAHYGELEIWPLPVGQRATLEIRPYRRFDIGMGPGQGGKVEVLGGLVGLVVDTRGRPLVLPKGADQRRRALRRWALDVGG